MTLPYTQSPGFKMAGKHYDTEAEAIQAAVEQTVGNPMRGEAMAQAICQHAAELIPLLQRLGAINTPTEKSGEWIAGYNAYPDGCNPYHHPAIQADWQDGFNERKADHEGFLALVDALVDEAFKQGQQARLAGEDEMLNPYDDEGPRTAWSQGWQDGFEASRKDLL